MSGARLAGQPVVEAQAAIDAGDVEVVEGQKMHQLLAEDPVVLDHHHRQPLARAHCSASGG
jgi:hypothetical protein